MAVIRVYNGIPYDRAEEDRKRHQKLIEESIKKNLVDILSEESLIGDSYNNKKIKVPIKGIKEYGFVFGKNISTIGCGDGDELKGEKIPLENNDSAKGNSGAGNREGEDIFETEITLEEVLGYVYDQLKLPYLKNKKKSKIIGQSRKKKSGFQREGIPPRLSKKRTVIEKIKRKQAMKRGLKEIGKYSINSTIPRFSFKKEDLRYFRIKNDKGKEYNAVVICIMDTSASMDQTKKYLARSFFYMIYNFIKSKYESADLVFISHSTTAKIVTEEEFFHKVESGGTYISSGYKKALELISQKYPEDSYNIYAFHATDGDNWSEDNERAVQSAIKLCETCNLFGYAEIMTYGYASSIKKKYLHEINKKNFIAVSMQKKEDLWEALKEMFKVELNIEEERG
ncbi:sporulation protein YhbH [uncultured Clostridium sp.]|uniref:sporulation protein YhbH n=1 Tax=uncultured Clostridium sp. TaxID=59620 RepID=UPI0028F1681D|nr:sporulation protein YhbH [uncultured Clostridium sp.]